MFNWEKDLEKTLKALERAEDRRDFEAVERLVEEVRQIEEIIDGRA